MKCPLSVPFSVAILLSGCRVPAAPESGWAIRDEFYDTPLNVALAEKVNDPDLTPGRKHPPVWFFTSEIFPTGTYCTTIHVGRRQKDSGGNYWPADIHPLELWELDGIFGSCEAIAMSPRYTGVLELGFDRDGGFRWYARDELEDGKIVKTKRFFSRQGRGLFPFLQ